MKSLKAKWTLLVAILLVAFIGSVILTNTFYLEDYYVKITETKFENELMQINEIVKENPDHLYEYLNKRNDQTGYKFYVIDNKYRILYISAPEFQPGYQSKLPPNLREHIERNSSKDEPNRIIYGIIDRQKEGKEVVQLAAPLDNKRMVVMTQSLEQLQESASIANDFLLLAGAVYLGVGLIVAYFLARKMVGPVLEITEVTNGIAQLDFTKKYSGDAKDEIGLLGQNINLISNKLDTTINHLKGTNEQLEREMKLQKRFLASVSHEFKTPVGLIRGYTESLKLGMVKTEKDKDEITDIIIKESDRLNILVKDIITLMHMDSGTYRINKRVFDIGQTLSDMTQKFEIDLSRKNVVLETNLGDELMVNGDELRISQVIENYLSNAIQHVNDNGLINIQINEEKEFVRIEIINTGDTIPSNHLDHLFEPFYRAEESRSRNSGGTGLGLSIVKGIIESHSGQCGVENVKSGVKFWFTIPTK